MPSSGCKKITRDEEDGGVSVEEVYSVLDLLICHRYVGCDLLFFFFYPYGHANLHSFPTRRSSDLSAAVRSTDGSSDTRSDAAQLPAFVRAQGVARHQIEYRRSEEHTSELQSRLHIVCRLLAAKK